MMRGTRLLVPTALVFLLIAACGDDSGGETATSPRSSPASSAVDGSPVVPPPSTTVGASGAVKFSGSLADLCGSLFSVDEVAALFEEPAMLDEDLSDGYDDGLGSVVCTWGTIEDPNDADDFASETLIVQVYLGDPIAGSVFYNPDEGYENVRHLDGIGDDAYVADLLGFTSGFLDGSVAGFVSYQAIDFGGDGSNAASEDALVDYLRLLHDRVT